MQEEPTGGGSEDTPQQQDDKSGEQPAAASNTQKNPDEWITGEEPMTGAQSSYLRTLCQEAGEDFDEGLTKAAASKRIDELQERTGRGRKK